MNQFLLPLALCTAALFAPQAHANQALATSKNCMSCHAVDKKLVVKVMQGGVGVWGSVPMSANPQVTEDEAKQLVTWVLAQK